MVEQVNQSQALSQAVEREVRTLIGDLQMQVIVLRQMLELQQQPGGQPKPGERPQPASQPTEPAPPPQQPPLNPEPTQPDRRSINGSPRGA